MSLGKVIPKSPLKDMPIKSKVPLKPQAVVLHQCYMWEWNLLSPNNHKIQSLSLQKSQLTFIFFFYFMLLYYLCHSLLYGFISLIMF